MIAKTSCENVNLEDTLIIYKNCESVIKNWLQNWDQYYPSITLFSQEVQECVSVSSVTVVITGIENYGLLR